MVTIGRHHCFQWPCWQLTLSIAMMTVSSHRVRLPCSFSLAMLTAAMVFHWPWWISTYHCFNGHVSKILYFHVVLPHIYVCLKQKHFWTVILVNYWISVFLKIRARTSIYCNIGDVCDSLEPLEKTNRSICVALVALKLCTRTHTHKHRLNVCKLHPDPSEHVEKT